MLFALCACGAPEAPAAAAVKKYLAATGKSGTVIFFGRPGEEGGAAKAYMVREKLRYEPDAVPVALWPPSPALYCAKTARSRGSERFFCFWRRFTGRPARRFRRPP